MEFVYAVPREELFPDHFPQGLIAFDPAPAAAAPQNGHVDRERFERVVRERGFFVERAHAERTPALKQPIPYAVVAVEDRVLLLRRTRGGGEARLHDKLSIGVGGHVDPIDAAHDGARGPEGGAALLLAAARRELEEELVVDGETRFEALGILNDDSNPVGAVHVGYVLLARVRGTVRVREHEQLEGRLARPQELRELLSSGADFETWSRSLVERIDEILTRLSGGPSPAHRPHPGAGDRAPSRSGAQAPVSQPSTPALQGRTEHRPLP